MSIPIDRNRTNKALFPLAGSGNRGDAILDAVVVIFAGIFFAQGLSTFGNRVTQIYLRDIV